MARAAAKTFWIGPIGARVTLTKQTLDVRKIYHHLTEELGFWEVGFAPVTASPERPHAFGDEGFEQVLAEFRALAQDYLAAALESALGVPAGGFFCAGEIGPVGGRNFLHGFTATMAVFPRD